jgi:hypothetical protein
MRPWLLPARVPRSIWLVGGAGVALACALAAPSTALLPAPASGPAKLGAAAALFLAFALGFLRPRPALYLLVVLAVGEGAVRKWLVNDIDVFLLKDVLLLGIYAGVLPRLRRDALRRPWWLLAPLAGVIALALVESARSPSLSEAVVGLRSYTIDVPLLWVGPVLLEPARRALVLLVLTLALGLGEAVLAVAQALSQSPVLNKLVSGALPAEITVRGVTYLRASGTFMQSGTLAAFLAFAVLVSFTFVAVFRRGWRYVLGVAAPALLTWGLVYGAARSLFGTTLVALAVLLGVLAVQRRLASFLLVPASLGVGFVLLFTLVPAVEDGVHAVGRWWRVGPPAAAPPTPAPAPPQPKSASQVSGFLGRAANLNTAGGTQGLWGSRVKPQLELIGRQRLGHGTGTMTLGSEYASASAALQGESEYAKLAWELGLPGLALYVWFVCAFVVAAARGLARAGPEERPAAAVGLGIAALAPVWGTITFAPDYPIFGLFLYLLGGYAVARSARPRPAPAPAGR